MFESYLAKKDQGQFSVMIAISWLHGSVRITQQGSYQPMTHLDKGTSSLHDLAWQRIGLLCWRIDPSSRLHTNLCVLVMVPRRILSSTASAWHQVKEGWLRGWEEYSARPSLPCSSLSPLVPPARCHILSLHDMSSLGLQDWIEEIRQWRMFKK